MHVVQVNETSIQIKWNHSRACFGKDCDITFNLTWTPSLQAEQSESVETNGTMLRISSLKRDESYEATLTALCKEESQVTMVRTVVVAFDTFQGVYTQVCMQILLTIQLSCCAIRNEAH